MSQRHLNLGILAEKRGQLTELATRADALVASLNMQANPYLPIYELNVDQIASQAKELEETVYRIRELHLAIESLEKELGIKRHA